jgi:hypothetical protein
LVCLGLNFYIPYSISLFGFPSLLLSFLHINIIYLASNINLLTHYAKGTLLLCIHFSLELLIKLLFHTFPSRYFFAVAYISYLALEKGFPKFKQNRFHFTLKAFLIIFYTYYMNLIWFLFLKLIRYFNSLRL